MKRLEAPNHDHQTCAAHPDTKKNELDRFCMDCLVPVCYHCALADHEKHNCLKIRRYVYCEVINRQDICKFFNCSGIQTYHTNKTKVLFLKQRPQQHPQQQNVHQNHSCIVCHRNLQDASLYCSISCKVTSLSNSKHKEPTGKRKKLRKGVAVRSPLS